MILFITLFVTSFIVALSGAIMPGPLLTVTITESSRRGMMTGPLLIAGHAILELALVVALLMGLAPLLKMEPVFIVIALAGSAVLLWMGVGMLKSLPAVTLDHQRQQ
jgi:threonine/homoserine/homoserine lactone efflux protein